MALLAAYLVVFGTIAAYLLVAMAMRHLPPTSVGIIGIGEPVLASVSPSRCSARCSRRPRSWAACSSWLASSGRDARATTAATTTTATSGADRAAAVRANATTDARPPAPTVPANLTPEIPPA